MTEPTHDLDLSGMVLAHRVLLQRLVWMVTGGDAKGEALLKDGSLSVLENMDGELPQETLDIMRASARAEVEKILV